MQRAYYKRQVHKRGASCFSQRSWTAYLSGVLLQFVFDGKSSKLLSEQNPTIYRDTTITEYSKFYRSKGFDGTSGLLYLKI
ncbi:hypothetical protein YC2023_121672 [Brassica napus]